METLIGTIIRIRFYNEQSKFVVALVQEESSHKNIPVTGLMLEVKEGMRYRFYGGYVTHPKYGLQFKFNQYEEVLANDYDEIIRYLSSSLFKGIGKVLATRIVDALGENALEMIKEDKHVLDTIQGISPEKRDLIDYELNKNNNQEVIAYLMKHGLTIFTIEKIVETYKENIIDLIEHNPYQLLEDIENIGFKNVDKLALSIGIENNDPNRLEAIVINMIKELCYQSGNTYIPFDYLLNRLRRFDYTIDDSLFIETIENLKQEEKLAIRQDKVFVDLYENAEKEIVESLKYFNNLPLNFEDDKKIEKLISTIEQNDNITFASNQKQAIIEFVKHPLMILTGGPGTGKTTIVKAAIEVYQKLYQTGSIALVAPTGRAAKRLSELTGLEAQTIHRLLRWDISSNEFMLNEDNPLECDLLIIDEFSMVDTVLFYHLLQASRLVKKILIIGDYEQLPSVSPGNLLRDLLAVEDIFSIRLTEIYRQKQSSGIVQMAHDISKDTAINEEIFKQYSDINFIECSNIHMLTAIKKIVQKALNEGYDCYDVQVLAPMYQGIAGIDAINEMLQELFNPKNEYVNEINVGNKIFREGDKILQLKNRVEDNVFNGDIGELVEIRYKDNFENLTDSIVVDFDGTMIEYTSTDFNQITLAYCMSIHKAQGSEFRIVIMPILSDYYIMLKKNLVYTGITRAKQSLFLVGQSNVFMSSIQKEAKEERLTYLKERFNEEETFELSPYDFM